MGKLKTFTRRAFLVTTAAVAGGVAFGVYQAKRALENPLKPGRGQTVVNPYLIVDADGVTIIAPRAEMGQGIHTTLAAMVAEELDVAWQDIRVLHGPAAQTYYNGVLPGMALPFVEYSQTPFQAKMKGTASVLAKVTGLQVTGGSTSTIDGFEKMRMAGATARETFKMATADRLGVDIAQLTTKDGAVIATDGTRFSYSELASDALEFDPPSDLVLREPSDWSYLGTEMPRVDQVAKSTGTAKFGADIRLPGMKFATVKMNPALGAPLSGLDASEALAMPGVEKVIPLPGGFAVVATNTWLALQGAEAVKPDWAQATYPKTTEALLEVIRTSLDDAPDSTLRDEGDVDAALDAADDIITADYTLPWLAHATMEPMNATALFTGELLEVWCGNQSPLVQRDKCAAALGLDPEQVVIETPYLGGGFGRRSEFDYSLYAALVAKEMPGIPVKVTWSREEDMTHDYYRPAAVARFKGVVKDGQIRALDGAIAAPSVTRQSAIRLAGFAPPGADKGHVEGSHDQPYGIPNFRINGHIADLDVPVGFWRSVGNSFNAFMFDSFIDELAHAAGRDPLDLRAELIAREHIPSAALLETVKQMSSWADPKEPGTGRGVAFTYSFGTPVAQVIEVRNEDDEIRVAKAWIACDVGHALDPGIIRAQMASGLIYGLSAAIMGEITFADGQVEQQNFPDYDALRMHTAPEIEVEILEANTHMGGAGEPGLPPAAPALANALFDLTGIRARELPLNKTFTFVS